MSKIIEMCLPETIDLNLFWTVEREFVIRGIDQASDQSVGTDNLTTRNDTNIYRICFLFSMWKFLL